MPRTHKSDSSGGGISLRLLVLATEPWGLEVARGAGLPGDLWGSDGYSGEGSEFSSVSDVSSSSSLASGAVGDSGSVTSPSAAES